MTEMLAEPEFAVTDTDLPLGDNRDAAEHLLGRLRAHLLADSTPSLSRKSNIVAALLENLLEDLDA